MAVYNVAMPKVSGLVVAFLNPCEDRICTKSAGFGKAFTEAGR